MVKYINYIFKYCYLWKREGGSNDGYTKITLVLQCNLKNIYLITSKSYTILYKKRRLFYEII